MTIIKIKNFAENYTEPYRGSKQSAGYDLIANIIKKITIPPGARYTIPTGIGINIPDRYFGQICSRSGLAAAHGIINLGGVIDSDYTGEISCILTNQSKFSFTITPGMRIAQLLIIPVLNDIIWEETEELEISDRGDSGFGSTGC